ncbi:DUF2155 domain-containing protein [Profundibacter amoris]|uniref:DUF2155 domain-containing protein n=1 Tax=Profundibacter amoris TaxID=2171755 RepID=A0A347UEC8_9RHOB|nr:DUF2155 domain-containing protein [Profundibacter amoris]AXX97206.1 DUF2155 domain-containing protein [Profundibacter amoris]
MMRILFLLFLTVFAAPIQAQQVSSAPGAVLRGLDKLDGSVTDLELAVGENKDFGRLNISLGDCRYPKGNPAGNAFAFLTIRENGMDDPVFQGWMIAAAPALDALDNARYDVWVLRCMTE